MRTLKLNDGAHVTVAVVATMLLAQQQTAFGLGRPPSPPWIAIDIGDVGVAGETHEYDGDYYVSGAGADIWGSADAFQFMFQPFQGDGEIVVGVSGESGTEQYAKAGVMIRQTTDPSSPNIMLDINPDGRVELTARLIPGGDTVLLATGSVPATSRGRFPAGLKLERAGNIVTALISGDQVGTQFHGGGIWTFLARTEWMSGPALIGLAVTSHDASTLNHASFPGSPTVSKVPPRWTTRFDPSQSMHGDAWYAGGTFTVSGAAAGIESGPASFRGVVYSVKGDTEIVARLTSVEGASDSAKAGVILTQSFFNRYPLVALDVRPNRTLELLARPTQGADLILVASDSVSFPIWLKLDRHDDQVTASISDDGCSWRFFGSSEAELDPQGYGFSAGLAVTSPDESMWTTATVEGVSVFTAANLIVNPGFVPFIPPELGIDWVSDRSVTARSETDQPHTGSKNAVCSSPDEWDCGMYQELPAPFSGVYTLTLYANADRDGGLVGANVNGSTVASQAVEVRGFRNYGDPYTMTFAARSGDLIHVWMYSPPTPGEVVVDDFSLTVGR